MGKIKLHKEPNMSVKLNAFEYQSEAVTAIRDLEYAAIFHEQGLGKSKIAIIRYRWHPFLAQKTKQVQDTLFWRIL